MVVVKLPVKALPLKSKAEPFNTVKTQAPVPRFTADANCKVLDVDPVPISQPINPEIVPEV